MTSDNGYAATLKEGIEKILEGGTYPNLNDMLQAYYNRDIDGFMNAVERVGRKPKKDDPSNEEAAKEKKEKEIEVAKKIMRRCYPLVASCINDGSDELKDLLVYCNLSSDYFADLFKMICCTGRTCSLKIALDRIFEDRKEDDDDFMKKEPAKSLFDEKFYQRIVKHDSVYLIEELERCKKVSWDKDCMLRLAKEKNYSKVYNYLTTGVVPTAADQRTELDRPTRTQLARKLQKAVKMGNVLELEQLLQDLEAYKLQYYNVDDILNESVRSEDGQFRYERLMHWACRQGGLDVCEALFRKGASLRVVDTNLHTPAHMAIKEGHLPVLKWLNDCDDNLIFDFFEYGWKDPLIREEERKKKINLFTIENVKLPIIEYLLSLGWDEILPEENIDDFLTQAIKKSNGNYSCIDTLLKREKIRGQVDEKHLKMKAVEKDDQLLSRLLTAAPRECIEKIVSKENQNKTKSDDEQKKDKEFFGTWRKRCPEALPAVFAKFVGPNESGEAEKEKKRQRIQKKIFKQIVEFSLSKKASPQNVFLLKDENVDAYIKDHLNTIWLYYIDLILIIIHLFLLTVFCISHSMSNTADEDQEQPTPQSAFNLLILFFLILFTAILSVKQVVEFIIERSKFFNPQDRTECGSYILSIVVMVWLTFWPRVQEGWQTLVIILCFLFSWINIFMKCKLIPWQIGLYFEMFWSILKTFKGVILMFIMFLACFSTIFFILFGKQEPFEEIHSLVGKTLAMLTGEFDFDELFEKKANSTLLETHEVMPIFNITKLDYTIFYLQKYHNFLGYYVFFLFCIVVHILLLNLLIGLAVGDISEIRESSKERQRLKQAELIVDLEIVWGHLDKLFEWLAKRVGRICNCFRGCCKRIEGDGEGQRKEGQRWTGKDLEKNQVSIPMLDFNAGTDPVEITTTAENVQQNALEAKPADTASGNGEKNGKTPKDDKEEQLEEINKKLELLTELNFQMDRRIRDLTDKVDRRMGEPSQ